MDPVKSQSSLYKVLPYSLPWTTKSIFGDFCLLYSKFWFVSEVGTRFLTNMSGKTNIRETSIQQKTALIQSDYITFFQLGWVETTPPKDTGKSTSWRFRWCQEPEFRLKLQSLRIVYAEPLAWLFFRGKCGRVLGWIKKQPGRLDFQHWKMDVVWWIDSLSTLW